MSNIGTNANNKKDNINNGITSLIIECVFIKVEIIIAKAKKVKIRCLVKKNRNLCLTFHQLMMKLMNMKKINLKIIIKN